MRELTFEEIKEALRLRQGGTALVYEYQLSHSWFVLRITNPKLAGNFHLILGSCDRIEFDISWGQANIEIEKDGENYLVRDSNHLFVKCGIVLGKYNVPPIW
ncbi:MAG: hypothetical protein LUM44_21675 [Pyrinomonadaceae bacterium]|nr:hypothetical protein [Pyrinomonadaceae bacterium]